MFASQVPQYLDDDLLGTDATHAGDNFVPSHPLYRAISRLADVTQQHPALRNGAQQVRYASDGRRRLRLLAGSTARRSASTSSR